MSGLVGSKGREVGYPRIEAGLGKQCFGTAEINMKREGGGTTPLWHEKGRQKIGEQLSQSNGASIALRRREKICLNNGDLSSLFKTRLKVK